MVVSI
jgi:NIMA (never in mitosis gene a)-related kinase 1/4/5